MNIFEPQIQAPPPLRLFLTLVAFVAALAIFLVNPATRVYAQTDPAVSVAGGVFDYSNNDTTLTVPVDFDSGEHDLSSVGFTLEYDETCVHIADPNTDISGFPADYVATHDDDPESGTLVISVRDEVEPLLALSNGALLTVNFTLDPACRVPGSHTAEFTFASVSFGDTSGENVPGSGTPGSYTLNVNRAPTGVNFTPTDAAIIENVTTARAIGLLEAVDPDLTDTHTFLLTSGCGGSYNNEGFALNAADSHELRTTRTFNFEGVGSYTLCVLVNDGEGGTLLTTFNFAVVDANDTPSAIALGNGTVVEGTAGATVGAFSSTDEDAGETFSYSLVNGFGDNSAFTLDDAVLKTASAFNYDAKPQYLIKVRSTDSELAAIERQFTIVVLGKSLLQLPDAPDLYSVVAGQLVSIPVTFVPKGNLVNSATFAVTYNNTCLDFARVSALPASFSNTIVDANDDGTINIGLHGAGGATLSRGVIAQLVFTGTVAVCEPGAWTNLGFSGMPDLRNSANVVQNDATSAGKLVTMANDALGDCNSDGSLNAGDFSATALEIFDSGSEPGNIFSSILADSWLFSSLGTYVGSPKGCDSNQDKKVLVSDIVCTARLFFGDACSASSLAVASQSAVAQLLAPLTVTVAAGAPVQVPVELRTNGHAVAAVAFSLNTDPSRLTLDATDSNEDGVPDSIDIRAAAGFFSMASYDPASGVIQVLVTAIASPLPTLNDGRIATVTLQANPAADESDSGDSGSGDSNDANEDGEDESSGGNSDDGDSDAGNSEAGDDNGANNEDNNDDQDSTAQAIRLSLSHVSLGGTAGEVLAVETGSLTVPVATQRLFVPSIMR